MKGFMGRTTRSNSSIVGSGFVAKKFDPFVSLAFFASAILASVGALVYARSCADSTASKGSTRLFY